MGRHIHSVYKALGVSYSSNKRKQKQRKEERKERSEGGREEGKKRKKEKKSLCKITMKLWIPNGLNPKTLDFHYPSSQY